MNPYENQQVRSIGLRQDISENKKRELIFQEIQRIIARKIEFKKVDQRLELENNENHCIYNVDEQGSPSFRAHKPD